MQVGKSSIPSDIIERWRVTTQNENGVTEKTGLVTISMTFLSSIAMRLFDPKKVLPFNRSRLNNFSQGDQASTACRVVAEMVFQYIVHTLRYPPHLSRDNPHWTAVISRDNEGEISFQGAGIYQTLQNNEEKLRAAIEAVFLNAAGGIAERLDTRAIDVASFHRNPEFVVDLFIEIMSATGAHLEHVNTAVSWYGKEVSSDVMRTELGKELHRGLSCDSRLNDAKKRLFSIDNFFRDLSCAFLEIALPKGSEEIQMVKGFQERSFKLLRDLVLPNILYDLTETLTSRAMLNSILFSAIEAINSPEEVDRAKKALKKRSKGRDGRQKRLDTACSRVVSQVTTLLVPRIGFLFGIAPGMAEKIGARVGNAIRKKLESMDLFKAINQLIETTLPTIHEGVWGIDKGKKIFIPGHKDKNGCFKPSDRLHFTFPKNDFDHRNALEKKTLQDDLQEEKVIEALAEMIAGSVRSILPACLDSIRAPFLKVKKEIIDELLPTSCIAFLIGLEMVCDFIFFRVIGTIVQFLILPLNKTVNHFLKRYSRSKAEEIIRRVHMDVHKNLAYECWDIILATLQLETVKK